MTHSTIFFIFEGSVSLLFVYLFIFFMEYCAIGYATDPTLISLHIQKIKDILWVSSQQIKTVISVIFKKNKNTILNEIKDDSLNEKHPEKQVIRYEDKYIDQIRDLPDEYIFDNDEEAQYSLLFNKYLTTALKELENNKTDLANELAICEQEVSDIENMEFNDDDRKVTYDDETGEEIQPFEDRMREKKDVLSGKINGLTETIHDLRNKVINKDEVSKQAKTHVMNERLDKLLKCFIIEKTPLGNVLMFYNNTKEAFEYYSDNSIPYRFLDVVSRKYVLTFNCRFLYVDMESEIKKYEQKIQEKEKEKQMGEEDVKKEDSSNSKVNKKNVFAKFKSYNKEAGFGKVNKAPPPKNSIPNKMNNNNKEAVLLKEKSNRYTYEGKFANFNMLQKIDRKKVDKKYSMSFADFKKKVINQK
jgi:hypothetical protein